MKASDQLPIEHKQVVLQWIDTKKTWRGKINDMRDENGNISGLYRLQWLCELPYHPSPNPEVLIQQRYAVAFHEFCNKHNGYTNKNNVTTEQLYNQWVELKNKK